MKTRRHLWRGLPVLTWALVSTGAWAAGGGPAAELEAYKAETKSVDLLLRNPNFRADVASTRANRSVSEGERSAEADGGSASPTASGAPRFASPTIYGTVHGDVTVIVQRGAVRGDLLLSNRRR